MKYSLEVNDNEMIQNWVVSSTQKCYKNSIFYSDLYIDLP